MTPQPASANFMQKIMRHPLVRAVFGFIFISVVIGLSQAALMLLFGDVNPVISVLLALLTALIVLGAYALFVRLLEQRPVTELSTRGALAELAAGIALGGGLMTIIVALLWVLGYYRVIQVNGLSAMLPMLALAITSGVTEEVLFRGIFFRLLEKAAGTVIALAVTSLFFGLVHMANPNASLLAALAIALEAGIMLGAAFMLTRRLWLAIGIHFAWNFAQGGIFGVPVSGISLPGLLQPRIAGPELLTGGPFGVEASLLALALCLLAGLLLVQRARQRGHWVSAPWTRAKPSA